jgi:hypothetical protein
MRPSGKPRHPSAHRAVLYAAAVPGWGEIHAGSWLFGCLTHLAFLGGLALFTWQTWELVMAALESRQQTMVTATAGLGLGLLGMTVVWYWGQFHAAIMAQKTRERAGLPRQQSPAWAALFSWLCPGCGQAYAGRVLFGALLLGAYSAGLAFKAPDYLHLFRGIKEMLQNPALAAAPLRMVADLKQLFVHLEFSIATVFLTATKTIAIADCVQTLVKKADSFSFDTIAKKSSQDEDKTPWYKGVEARSGGLFLLGYVAPGAGQIMQGRALGWLFLGLYLGGLLGISLALTHGLVRTSTAQTLSWGPTLVLAAAMFEAPITLLRQSPAAPDRKDA